MKLIKTIGEADMLPPFYGVAWQNYHAPTTVCLPVPFNMLAGFLRSAWLFLKHGWRPIPLGSRQAYDKGYKDAQKHQTIGRYRVESRFYQGGGHEFLVYEINGRFRWCIGHCETYADVLKGIEAWEVEARR
jgi:hypothetical protein